MRSLDEREREAVKKRRDAANWRKWNEPRSWLLKCSACDHEGEATTTLKRLKSSNIKCSACGAYLWRSASD